MLLFAFIVVDETLQRTTPAQQMAKMQQEGTGSHRQNGGTLSTKDGNSGRQNEHRGIASHDGTKRCAGKRHCPLIVSIVLVKSSRDVQFSTAEATSLPIRWSFSTVMLFHIRRHRQLRLGTGKFAAPYNWNAVSTTCVVPLLGGGRGRLLCPNLLQWLSAKTLLDMQTV